MRTSSYWIIAAMVNTAPAFGQQTSNERATVLTVCEVLGGMARYADADIAVVGRMERSVSLIDHYEFLSQDQCEYPVITHGHVWPDMIQIWTNWEPGMPKPPGERPRLERSVLAAKLLIIRKTTELGTHEEPRFKNGGGSLVHTRIAVPNEWAVVYGRVVRAPRLVEDCGPGGCGGDDVPLGIIARPYNVHRLDENGWPVPEDK